MKTAEILKKSVLNPGKSWITLLNSANLIKKNAVTPVNFHLYHYAGNNPVRYTDPDGRDHGMPPAIEEDMNRRINMTPIEKAKLRNVCANGNTTARTGLPPSIETEMKYKNSYTHGVPSADLEQIKLKDNRRTRIKQQDIKFPEPQGPCFFLALEAAAQEKAGKNLNYNQTYAAKKHLIAIGAMNSNYYVKDPKAVVEDALNRLDYHYSSVSVSDYQEEVGDEKPDYTIRNVLGGSHYQVGNSNGDFLWEPYRYNSEKNADKGKPVRIREVNITSME